MNIKKVKEIVQKNTGKPLKFKFNGARNQIEEFEGIIKNSYPSVFTIETSNQLKNVKSFTYSDLLTNSLEIIEIKIEQ